jgi:hypothetical protein
MTRALRAGPAPACFVCRPLKPRSMALQMCAGCCPHQRTWAGWSSTEQRCVSSEALQNYGVAHEWTSKAVHVSTGHAGDHVPNIAAQLHPAGHAAACITVSWVPQLLAGRQQAQQCPQHSQQHCHCSGGGDAVWHAAAGQVTQVRTPFLLGCPWCLGQTLLWQQQGCNGGCCHSVVGAVPGSSAPTGGPSWHVAVPACYCHACKCMCSSRHYFWLHCGHGN